ncbi:hypothetical protein JAAARDRAFT_185131 [Jaapia argillacea MUCL 33604]|uniref:Dihydrolipoamide acetyltransferase component of pyruvate dehydrogenase complex n=1 Tax=Jaapia argillacea MUCL 33604 TaxID=933084 RepID=A0A067P8W1_9AGAM|nr:hypothetical protein JAAARDRAFT_185131 [Jaapia argillacea MUCL 33604]
MFLPRRLHGPLLRGRVAQFHSAHACWASRKVLQKFKLADIGEGITECEVIRWNVKESATIQAFDQLCEVQSDKASVEITSPFDGVVKQFLVKEGEVAKVGEGLCLIEVDEDAVADEPNAESIEPASESKPAANPPPHLEQEATQASDFDTSPPSPAIPDEAKPLQEAPPVRKPRPHPLDPKFPQTAETILKSFNENVRAKPATRHFARQLGVDLSKLAPGSGKDGRIEKGDVEAFLSLSRGETKASGVESTSVETKVVDGKDVVVELGRTRYGMWKAMEKSLEIPHFGYSTTLDLTNLHQLLSTLNKEIPQHYLPPSHSKPPQPPLVSPSSLYPAPSPPPIPEGGHFHRLTYLPIFLKTLSKAMMEWPLFRASITPSSARSVASKPTLTIRPNADIALALSTPTGLYTPLLPSTNNQSIYSIASSISHLSHLARQTPCGLTTSHMPKRGGTITVSNVGAIGKGDWASPVLVPGGGVAIVAIGRAKWVYDVDTEVWDKESGQGQRRLKVGVSWSADHRVVEGAELAAFVECWRGWVEKPERLIVEGV